MVNVVATAENRPACRCDKGAFNNTSCRTHEDQERVLVLFSALQKSPVVLFSYPVVVLVESSPVVLFIERLAPLQAA